MSEENKKLIDDLEDREEYERALAALNKSKGERVKKIVEEKKIKKQKEREAFAKVSSADASKPNGFVDKCKKDPVIPACILALVIAVVFVVIRFVVPLFSVKTLGVTVDEYRQQYMSAGIYNSTLMPYDFAIPEVTYSDGQTLALTATSESNKQDKLSYFYASIPNSGTGFGTAIQGSVSRTNNEITALRVIAEYSNDPNYFNFLILYFGSYLQGFIPDVSDNDVQTLVANSLNNISTGEFTSRQDISYRAAIISDETGNFVVFDILPTANLNK